MTDRELLELDLHTGFTWDARGRMVATNEPLATARRPAPALYILAGADHELRRFGAALPDAVVDALAAIDRDGVADVLARHAPIEDTYRGPSYVFPDAVPAPHGPIEIDAWNVPLARETYPWLVAEHAAWPPCFGVLCDGAVVSICFSARLAPDAAAAGVDTLPAYRGRGFATAVTAAWGRAIRASGRTAFYGTSHDNHASQGVARRLGLRPIGVAASWTLSPG